MIFDTGAQNTILFDRQLTDLSSANYERELMIKGADLDQELKALVAKDLQFQFSHIDHSFTRDVLVLAEPIDILSEYVGQKIHGIIGTRFLKGIIYKIDYEKNKLVLYHPEYFTTPSLQKYHKIPIDIHEDKPYIKAKIHNEYLNDSVNLLLDSGASIGLLLNNIQMDSSITKNLMISSLGRGLGGDILGYIGLSDSIDLGINNPILEPITYYQQIESSNRKIVRDGILGNQILEKFNIIIDPIGKYIFLKENNDFYKEPKRDKSGLKIIKDDHKNHVVSYVIKDSPAYHAGVEIGDVIQKINWRNRYFLSLSYLNKKFSGKTNNKVKLTLLRNGIKYKTEIYLKDYLQDSKH